MKIAYIIYPNVIVSNKSNGIRSQAITWAECLRRNGIDVDLINNWDDYSWKEYDIIHFFGGGSWLAPLAERLKKYCKIIVWSPIEDPTQGSSIGYKLIETIKKHLPSIFRTSYFYANQNAKSVDYILVRSKYEEEYVNKVYRYSRGKTTIIPLSYSQSVEDACQDLPTKENFCLHISSIYQKRKNVIPLIMAAKKYSFKLILAGNKGSDKQFAPIKEAIGNAKNIEVLGFITEEQKIDLYKRAKVFALPSLTEGVGIVALDAALYGCEIVITNIKGPKEYYNGRCTEVNPRDTDAIGKAVVAYLDNDISYQPYLKDYLSDKYSLDHITEKLIHFYKELQIKQR